MLFALTEGRRRPRPEDVLRSPGMLSDALDPGLGSGTLRVWEAIDDPEEGWAFVPVGSARRATGDRIMAACLRYAAPLYNNGDCWVMAYVAGRALDRPVTAFVAPGVGRPGEPDHLAVDLGDGLFLDVRGVLDADGIAVGLKPGSAPGQDMPAEDVPALYDRLYGEPGDGFAEKLANGFSESTRILFDLFLKEGARAALAAHEPGCPAP